MQSMLSSMVQRPFLQEPVAFAANAGRMVLALFFTNGTQARSMSLRH